MTPNITGRRDRPRFDSLILWGDHRVVPSRELAQWASEIASVGITHCILGTNQVPGDAMRLLTTPARWREHARALRDHGVVPIVNAWDKPQDSRAMCDALGELAVLCDAQACINPEAQTFDRVNVTRAPVDHEWRIDDHFGAFVGNLPHGLGLTLMHQDVGTADARHYEAFARWEMPQILQFRDPPRMDGYAIAPGLYGERITDRLEGDDGELWKGPPLVYLVAAYKQDWHRLIDADDAVEVALGHLLAEGHTAAGVFSYVWLKRRLATLAPMLRRMAPAAALEAHRERTTALAELDEVFGDDGTSPPRATWASALDTIRAHGGQVAVLRGAEVMPYVERFAATYGELGYAWFDRGDHNLNLGGIRSPSNEVGVFDDVLYTVRKVGGVWEVKLFAASLDAGPRYHEHWVNPRGTAGIMPGQYRGAYARGNHRPMNLTAPVQVAPVDAYRDRKDPTRLDYDASTRHRDRHGLNVHSASRKIEAKLGDRFVASSAGCLITASHRAFVDELMTTFGDAVEAYGNRVTMTILDAHEFDPSLEPRVD